MKLRDRIKRWLARPPQPSPEAPALARKPLRVSAEAVAQSRVAPPAEPVAVDVFKPAAPPPGVLPSGGIAMDEMPGVSWAALASQTGVYSEGVAWLGFPHLAELAQRPEYRKISETIATEMTRCWIRVTATGGKDAEDKTDKIAAINEALDSFKIREMFGKVAEQDGFFGRGHLYVDLGTTDDEDELKTAIGDGKGKTTKTKVAKGSLKGFQTVEAVWCYPAGYNTTNPLLPDWYKPTAWYVQGRQVHATRLLTFIGREVPDLLKPAYSFGGLSMSQMARPYVENWLRTRQSVADLISSFSVSGIKIDLAGALNTMGGAPDAGDQLFRRVDLFNNLRDNRGTMVLNKGAGPNDPAEEFFNVSTPLGTLDKLQAQSQEHMCSVANIPLVKFTGITPSGLNASSEGEIRVFYDGINAYQEKFFRPHLTTVINLIQMHLFDGVDPDIGFVFEPLWSLDEEAAASVRKTEAETDAVYVENGVLEPLDVRKRLASEEGSPYAGLDVEDVPLPAPGEGDVPDSQAKRPEDLQEAA
ncbi:DUF1073 domain-containing protein [Bosea sp. 2KB_26]|uniref:DUF1073 domain-containing protein n=1 Tax=Bosea sp. 2KB_26 TaxID=3237475 RepID=UPI003F9379C3